ncbi:hypothetical protein Tco_1264224 [Tanacetum coccineum]
MLTEERRSKMLLKQHDPMVLEKKVNTTPVDYADSINSSDPSPSCRPTKVEVPKELPKVSMGFEHTKACFRDEIIPFVKALKDIFNTIDQYLIDELTEVQNVFHQMEQAMEQHHLESKTFEIKMNQVLNKNERLLEQVINKDIVNIIMNSTVDNASVNVDECKKCLKLETELLNKRDFIEKETYDKLFRSCTTLEKHCISLEVDTQLNHENFQMDNSVSNQKKDLVITALNEELRKLKGKSVVACRESMNKPKVITPIVHKVELEPLSPKLKNNREAHVYYIRITKENDDTLRDIVEQARTSNPLDNALAYACMYTKQIRSC